MYVQAARDELMALLMAAAKQPKERTEVPAGHRHANLRSVGVPADAETQEVVVGPPWIVGAGLLNVIGLGQREQQLRLARRKRPDGMPRLHGLRQVTAAVLGEAPQERLPPCRAAPAATATSSLPRSPRQVLHVTCRCRATLSRTLSGRRVGSSSAAWLAGRGTLAEGQTPAQQASTTCSWPSSCHKVRPTPPVLGGAAAPG
jgi:hypothetical protein